MTVNYTTLLGLAKPVTGTEAGTWGTIVNDQITMLVEEAIASSVSLDVTAGNITLTTTNGVSNQARSAVLLVSGTPGTTRNIIAPSQSKVYVVINTSNAAVVVKGTASTGVTIPTNTQALVAWNGSDFVLIGVSTNNTQTLTNKTISVDSNTISGIAALSFVLSDGSGNIDGAVAQKAIPSGNVVGTSDTQTLSNKRIDPRVVSAGATSGSLTINGDITDVYKAEGLTGDITFLQPSGTPVDGQKLMIRLEDNGTGRNITWTTTSGAFRQVGIVLPSATLAGKVMYVGCSYNFTDSFWDAIAVAIQA